MEEEFEEYGSMYFSCELYFLAQRHGKSVTCKKGTVA